ncbi:retention module-containing protein [Vibrio aestuarianus]|uniref:retention module-containing protein n=5 Tax=Vibrio TaxID=662 RepID=UPI00237CF1F1|nr:retention module-containing protein [Vibrio aestuarianus]MDE1250871.1 retention module-containing protein [Vibrio aestuarianus]
MDFQVINQPVSVTEVVGEVIAVDSKGNARLLNDGDYLNKGEILITINHSSVAVMVFGELKVIDQNCVACLGEPPQGADPSSALTSFPIEGAINADLSLIENTNFDADNIAAIQQAILDGQDPTQILEATAAGAGGQGSANAGFISIDYNFTEVLARTFFETQGSTVEEQSTDDELGQLRFSAGGNLLSEALVEGSLSQGSYPQSVTSSVLIAAGDLPLDSASFVPTPLSLNALLSELAADITSSGRPVDFRYDAATNSIIGEQNGNEVLTINMIATSVGKDVNLEVITTITLPIDHTPEVGGGVVSFANDQISIQFEMTGVDSGENPIQSPISVSVVIGDGDNPVMVDEPIGSVFEDNLANVGSDSSGSLNVTISGLFDTQLGSDVVETYQVDLSVNPLSGLTSQGVAVEFADPSIINGVYIYQASANGTPIFELILNPDGNYQFTLQGVIDHPVDSDELLLELPIFATDYDGDTSQVALLPINIVDDKPVIVDSVPLDIHEDDLVTGSDSSKEPLTASGTFTTIEGADRVVSYQLDSSTNPIAGLTSQGESVSLGTPTLSNGAYTYQATTSSGAAVFTLVLNADGSYSFTLEGPIDHAASADELLMKFSVVATDFDGDSSSITLPVNIHDDKPSIQGIRTGSQQTVDEDDLSGMGSDGSGSTTLSGNFDVVDGADGIVSYQLTDLVTPVAGLQSGGQNLVMVEVSNLNGITVYEAQIQGSNEAVFRITLNGSADSYQFELLKPLDHATGGGENDLILNLSVTATDRDGDVSNAIALPITIIDDVPTISQITAGSQQTVDEDDLSGMGSDGSGSTTLSGNFDVVDGADGIVSYQLTDLVTPVAGLQSGGQNLELVEVSNSNGVIVYEARTLSSNEAVFKITFNGSADSYQFELLKPLDHATGAGENDLILNLSVTATDRDGDVSNAIALPITIIDDVPTISQITAGSQQTVDEDDLLGMGSDGSGSTTLSGNFDVVDGADGIVSYQLTDLVTPVAGLQSGGQNLVMVEVSNLNGITVYEAQIQGSNEAVFRITLNGSADSYQFELLKPLDHATGAGENDLILNLSVTATDRDGDVSNAIALPITIIDDVPTISQITAGSQQTVDEDDLSGMGSDGSGSTTLSGNFDVVDGADGIVSYQLTDLVTPVAGLQSGGQNLVMVEVSNLNGITVYEAQIQGSNEAVFRITLNGSADSYQFELLKPLDHATGAGENDLILNLSVTATDRDGDVSNAIALPITIIDDVPTISQITAGSQQTVDEDDLSGMGSDGSGSTTLSGNFDVVDGADGIVSYQLTDLVTPVAGLQSGGQNLVMVEVSNLNGITVYEAQIQGSNEAVFRITLNGSADSYQFELLKPLDHATGGGENDLILNLSVTATDRDGDVSNAIALPITIIDDVPTISQITAGSQQTVDEDDLSGMGSDGSGSTTLSGNFDVVDGADGIVSYQLTDLVTPVAGLQSGGQNLVMVEVPNLNGITVYEAQIQGSNEAVFRITLNGSADSYQFELLKPLDHATGGGENDLILNLSVTATDRDGDVSNAIALPITIIDDVPTISQITAGSQQTVDEDDLSGMGSDGSGSTTLSGNFDVVDGADGIVSYQLTDLVTPVAGLQSGGQNLELVEVSNSNGVIVYEARTLSSNEAVFKITFNGSADSYQFELLKPLDHATGAGENDLILNLSVTATDRDGDVSNAIALPITIIDDVPTISQITAGSQQTVDEDDLSGMGSDGSGSTTLSGNFDVVDGADGIVSYQLTDLVTPVAGLQSGGQNLVMVEVSNLNGITVYEAQIQGSNEAVFRITLNGSADSYQFELLKPLDHATGAGENDLILNLSVTATDRDGDVSNAIALPITIIDDVPTISQITAGSQQTVDEDDLSGMGSDGSGSTTLSGNFDVVDGADGIVSYQLTDLVTPVAGLQSGGQNLELVEVSNSNGVIVYEARTLSSNEAVFKITFNGSADSYQFELLKPLDHATGAGENDLILNLSVTATDRDGDVSNAIALPITIIDDVPTLHDKTITTVEGNGNRTVNLFSVDNNNTPDTQGADNGLITRFSAVDETGRDIQFRLDNSTSLVDSVDLNGSNKTVTVVEIINNVERDLGTLLITPTGGARFKPATSLDHGDSPEIPFTVDVTATDRDGDTSTEQLNVIITDRNAVIKVASVLGTEDAGRDGSVISMPNNELTNAQDNQAGLVTTPIKVDLQVELNDIDRNESIGDVTVKNINNAHGDFYYLDGSGNYIKLDVVGGKVVLPANMVEQSLNGTVASVDNLYFVPDRNYASADGGFTINLTVQILNDNSADHSVNGKMRIEVESVADIATWTTSSEFHYDTVEDSSNVNLNVAAQTQDTSSPEVIVYEIRFTQGEGDARLVYADGTPLQVSSDANGNYYLVDASKIAQVQVDPNDNFGGQIRLGITAITTEQSNVFIGKESARSETKEIIIDVTPDADMGSFSVNRINIFEDNAATQNTVDPETDHDPLLLSEVITMTASADTDSSESLHVRISDFSEAGVTLVWLGAGASQITTVNDGSGHTYFEVPEQYLNQVEVLPPKHSNADFTFSVEGIVKDRVIISSGEIVDEQSLGSKMVNVAVKGVADLPIIDFNAGSSNTWTEFEENGIQVVETTVDENQAVDIDFSVLSGEKIDNPSDNSESLTVLLSNIPDGVNLYDSDGSVIDLVFVGYDSSNHPIYQANLTTAQVSTGIKVEPVQSSTENIHIKASVIVTEDDGHTRQVESEIRINIRPVIDVADNYQSSSIGNEDSLINIRWQPENAQNPDADEYFAAVTLSGFPTGSSVYVNGVLTALDSNNQLVLTPAVGQSEQDFSNQVLSAGYIQVQPPEHSSTDFTLNTELVVKEQDHEYVDSANPGEGIVSKVIQGSVNVTVRPIVEPDGELRVENGSGVQNSVTADAAGVINFTINDAAGGETDANIIRFDNVDSQSTAGYQSQELVDQLVVRFNNVTPEVLDQLLITGAINNGDGTWTIVDENNFSIKAPNGLILGADNDPDGDGYNEITLTIFAQVFDKGEDSSEVKTIKEVHSDITLKFPDFVTGNDSEAADINLVGDVDDIVLGSEDHVVNLGQQIQDKLMISASGFDGVSDELSIVIAQSLLPAGASLSGAEFDFVDGLYVYKGVVNVDGSISGLENLQLNLPEDYAGDFKLPVTFVTTDTASGDEKTTSTEIPVAVSPIADIPGSDQPADSNITPRVTLTVEGTLGLDADHQPTSTANDIPTNDGIGYEDGIIHLTLDLDLADIRNDLTQGQETLTEVTLTVQGTNIGTFVDADGNELGTQITFNSSQLPAALDNVYFKPAPNYPTGNDDNTVNISVSGKVTDTTTFDEVNPASVVGIANTDADKTFTTNVSFEVKPVVDDIAISGSGSSTPEVEGLEDEWIVLSKPGSEFNIDLTDTDGSEEFVSIKLTGVPTDFIVSSLDSNQYVVKNNGGGEWSIQLKDLTQTSLNLSNIAIKPAKNFSGEVEIGVKIFTQESLLGVPVEHTGSFKFDVVPVGDAIDVEPVDNVAGNEGEDIAIDIKAQIIDNIDSISAGANYTENSPETLRVEISGVPDGASIALADGTLGTNLGAGVWLLNVDAQSLDKLIFNSGDWNNSAWTDALHFKVQSVDTGLDGIEHLGPVQEFDVAVDITAVNDRPEFSGITNTETAEDTPITLNGFMVSDADSTIDNPNAEYVLMIDVEHGVLQIDPALLGNLIVTGDGTTSVELKGTITDLNSALAAGVAKFVPETDFNGAVNVNVSIDDQGNNGLVIATDDGTLNSNSDQFTINVTEVNDAPMTASVTLPDIDEDAGSITIVASQLLANASDTESDTLTVSNLALVDPAMGTLIQTSVGEWTFEPALDFYGQVNFTYDITDDGTTNGVSDPQSVSGQAVLDVLAVNDAPVIDGVSITTTIDESAAQKVTGITVSDVDYSGSQANQTMSVTLSVTEGILSVVIPAGSSVTQTPALNGDIVLQGTLTDINALLNTTDPINGVFIDATAIAGDTVALTVKANDVGVYADNASGMALEDTETFTITVTPKANAPTLTVDPSFNYIKQSYVNQSVSNQGIALVGLVATLTDSHEVLSLEIHNLPSGAALSSATGSVVEQSGVWVVSADAINSLEVSGLSLGAHTLSVTAISTETDGSFASSTPLDIQIDVLADGTVIDQSSNSDDSQLLADDSGLSLTGGSGDDYIEGGAGDDILHGGAGNDILVGGLGADILTGDGGADIFKWTLDSVDDKTDTITDFSTAEGDVIDLTDVVSDLGSQLPMDQLLASLAASNQIEAKVIANTDDVELDITTDNNVHQTIVVEDLANQFSFDGMTSIDIVGTLLDNNIIKHD